ncbi:mucin-5B-like [Coturnix japonica]|uniref:Mucin-5B-like n=1 Tax=Coturnix japonica TaxID=93934 RepID=A0A8C2TG53_COTJA|nr:mucin-5B-like [Coturnix japonica]
MERVPRLVAAAVLVGCCARLCPALGGGTGSTRGTAAPCAHPGQRCRTDPQHGAGWLQTEAELFPFPGTPPGTAEPPGTSSSPGEAGTGPAVRDGVSTEAQNSLSAGTTDAAADRDRTSPTRPGDSPAWGLTAVTVELSTAPAISAAPRPEPIGNEKAESAPASQRTLLHSLSHVTVSSSTGGQRGTPSTMRTEFTQSWGGSTSPSYLKPQGRGATILPSDSRAGTPQGHTTDSPMPGTSGTLPFVGGMQNLQSSPGELGRMHQVLAGTGPAGESHPLQGTTMAWLGPHATSHPSMLSPGVGGRGGLIWHPRGPGASTALLPMESHLPPDHSTTATATGVMSPGLEGAPDLTTEVLVLPSTQGPPGPNRDPMNQTWHISALPREAPTSPGPQLSLGLSPTADTPPVASPGHEHAVSPQVPVWAGDAEPWAVTAPLSTTLPAAPSSPLQPALTQPSSSPLLLSFAISSISSITTTTSITTTVASTATATATSTDTATSPTLLRDERTALPEPSTAACQGAVEELTRGPRVVPGSPHQPTDPPRDAESPQPQSSPTERPHAGPTCVTPNPAAAGRATPVFITEDQPPLLRASLLRVPCELALDMTFVPALRDPTSHERHVLLSGFNRTVTARLAAVPGFVRLEVTAVREGRARRVELRYDALFAAELVRAAALGALLDAALRSGGTTAVGTARVVRHEARAPEPCAALFSCPDGFACVVGSDGNATCTSLCHRDYCRNHGVCAHPRGRGPLCRCPAGSDVWFVGLRCERRVTLSGLLGAAAGALLGVVLLGVAVGAAVVRRFRALLREARAEQGRSSYRRFCRPDEAAVPHWARSWPGSGSSLDNPAFSRSEELLHLHLPDDGCCCRRDPLGAARCPEPPARGHGFQYGWDTSCSSVNEPMVDSGKASDISVSSWPVEPSPWAPFSLLQQLSRQQLHPGRRPRSFCDGMELSTLERSWTA